MEHLQEGEIVDRRPRIIVMGASLGGINALSAVLGGLPGDLCTPMAIALHRDKSSTGAITEILNKRCCITVTEARDKDPIIPGRIFLAPADYHLLAGRYCFSLSLEAPVNYSRPSIDVLFESAADSFGDKAVGVILTGLGTDGLQGARRIKGRGGLIIVQDPDSAEGRELPASVKPIADRALTVQEIPAFLTSLCGSGRGHADGR